MSSERFVRVRRLGTCALLAACFAIAPAHALPKSKKACAAAFESAQVDQRNGKLLAARQSLLSCSRAACGSFVQRECTALLEALEPRIPSIIVAVADASGRTLTDIDVSLDGEAMQHPLDGRAFDIDPGIHALVFATPEGSRKAEQLLVLEAAKHQRFSFRMPAPRAEEAPDPAPPPREPSVQSEFSRRPVTPAPRSSTGGATALPYVFGGVGVLGLAGFGLLGAMGKAEEQELPECWPDCGAARVERVRTLYLAADVSLGVAAAALGTSVVLFLTRSSAEREQATASRAPYTLDVRPARGGGVAGVSGRF